MRRQSLFTLAAVLSCSAILAAQNVAPANGVQLKGTVVDPTGGVMVNADVQLTTDMAPFGITMALSITTQVDVTSTDSTDLSVDSDSSLNTDVITGDALLDLPDNPDDLLAYLLQLAQLRGGEGDVTINVDGFNGADIPPLAQIAEIRIVNTSFTADGSTGPLILPCPFTFFARGWRQSGLLVSVSIPGFFPPDSPQINLI